MKGFIHRFVENTDYCDLFRDLAKIHEMTPVAEPEHTY
jgi:hypothetical protein